MRYKCFSENLNSTKRLVAKVAFVLISTALLAQNHQLFSPNGKLLVNISVDEGLAYSAEMNGVEVIQQSSIGMMTVSTK